MSEFTRYLQGNLTNQMKTMQDLVLQVQALLGQSQQRIADLREQLDRQQQQQQQQQTTQPVRPGGNSPGELYQTGVDKLHESPAMARAAFQAFLESAPGNAQAPDAQFYLAETFVMEGDTANAFKEFERVAANYPQALKAPEALFRAGVVAEENRNRTRARAFYNRVVKDFPNSDAAANARAKLRALPARN
jgi:tol-pal system protein YbgF